MSDKQPPRVQFNFEPDPVEEEVNEETGETNPNFIYSDEEVSETIDEIVPEVVEKEEIDEEKIFDLPNLAVRPDYLGEEPKALKQPKLTKKGVPRKPMSEAHKAKLAEARKKAAIVKAQKRKEREEEKAFKKQEKELLEKKKKKDFEKLKREVEEDEPPKEKVVKETKVSSGLTKEDLEKAQFEAIAKYELLRKQRKAEKKQAQALEAQKKELMERLKPQAQGYKYRDGSNRWDMCY
jgi:hypothetical protein